MFYLNQDASWQEPAKELTRVACRALKAQGLGQFITNGRAFQLFEKSPVNRINLNLQPQPNPKDRGRDGRGRESCRPDEPVPFHGIGVMSRFVDGDPLAIAIIHRWKFAQPIREVQP